jgi:signal transduction histidine kinase
VVADAMLETLNRQIGAPVVGDAGAARSPRVRFGLAARVLVLTVAFVMIAEVAIYIPSIANFRNNWLRDRLASARTAALVFQAAPSEMVPEALRQRILDSVGSKIIVLTSRHARRLLAVSDMPPKVDETYDLRDPSLWQSISATFRCLVAPPGRMLSVEGYAPMSSGLLEITMDETPLRDALRSYSIDVLLLSLLICAIFAALAVAAIHLLVLRPVQRLTSSIVAFGDNPEDATLVVRPSGRSDEIGRAETALGVMQRALVRELGQKKHLAALGLAVAKINHDLRNMLSSAQLISDRLSSLSDPLAQRLAPKLVATLDRAIGFCQATMVYGRAVEAPPKLRRFALRAVAADVADTAASARSSPVVIENRVPADLEIIADAEHLFRALLNLCRNAVQALESAGPAPGMTPSITIAARRAENRLEIEVADNGPGIAASARAGLFEAFQHSTHSNGAGLGLAIAADLVRAHGGTIRLLETTPGATFRIELPDRRPDVT